MGILKLFEDMYGPLSQTTTSVASKGPVAKTSDEAIEIMMRKIYQGNGMDIAKARWLRHLDALIAQNVERLHDVHINDWYFENTKPLCVYVEDETDYLRTPVQLKHYSRNYESAIELMNLVHKNLTGCEGWSVQLKQNGTYAVAVSRWANNTRTVTDIVHDDLPTACALAALKAYKVSHPNEPPPF